MFNYAISKKKDNEILGINFTDFRKANYLYPLEKIGDYYKIYFDENNNYKISCYNEDYTFILNKETPFISDKEDFCFKTNFIAIHCSTKKEAEQFFAFIDECYSKQYYFYYNSTMTKKLRISKFTDPCWELYEKDTIYYFHNDRVDMTNINKVPSNRIIINYHVLMDMIKI